jgi:tRNA(Ile)-lysidine synthase
MDLSIRVLRTVRAHGLVARGGRVVVALSGGADSVALVHLLRELQSGGALRVAGLAHVNHQLRGAGADADEAFCAAMAADLGLPFEAARADVRAIAAAEGRSIEDAARRVRYACLEQAADRLKADAIAVGHTLDDQAETFLLRLVRGAGPRGLAGIHPRAGRVVRPLLDVRRSELREYIRERGLAYREDPTNADVSIPRNRVRLGLIPYLEREFSPGIVEVLAREAAIARQDEDLLAREAIDFAQRIVLVHSAGDRPGSADTPARIVTVDARRLSSLHPAHGARVVRHALEVAAGTAREGAFGFEHLERVLALAREGREGAEVHLPGLVAKREGDGVWLAGAPSERPPDGLVNTFRFPLSIPGEVTLDRQGWVVSATDDGGAASNLSVGVQAARLTLPLAVRCWQPGDRFRPLGMGGRRKKLQDLFVDRKVPRGARGSVPLVVDGDDRIVWIVGEPVAEDFRVTEPSQGVIFLKARRLGGLG